ncbi:uncharacterized protein LOC143469130 [Clavelina lepadiformis]|uniref:uncharacterized protein LOC143469130 n=1 Tax=Clavelina lepadiformis TaxID=159417 RepID=UPI004042CAB3
MNFSIYLLAILDVIEAVSPAALNPAWTDTSGAITSSTDAASNTFTYERACATVCLCGTINVTNAGVGPLILYKNNWKSENAQVLESVLPKTRLIFPIHVVICLNGSMEHVPTVSRAYRGKGFVSQLGAVVFRRNHLRELRSNHLIAFRSSLRYIDLSYNVISYLDAHTFKDCPLLKEIDLRFNRLRHLGDTGHLFAFVNTERPHLRIHGNPIQCTCSLLTTIGNFVTIPNEDRSCCIMGKDYEVAANQTNWENLCQTDISKPTSVKELTPLLCHHEHDEGKVEAPSSNSNEHHDHNSKRGKARHGEEIHHTVDNHINKTMPHDDGEEHTKHLTQRVYKRSTGVDVPLLITMAAWFVMVYLGITKFIEHNAADNIAHSLYLRHLGENKLEP